MHTNKKANKRILGMTQTELLILVTLGGLLLCIITLFGGYVVYDLNRPNPVAVIPSTSTTQPIIQPTIQLTNSPLPVKPSDTPIPQPTSTSTAIPTVQVEVIGPENAKNIKEVFTFNVPGLQSMSFYWSSDNHRLLVQTCLSVLHALARIGCGSNDQTGLVVFNPFTGEIIRQLSKDISTVPKLFSGNGRFISIVDSYAPYTWKGHFLDVDTGQSVGLFNSQILSLNDTGELAVVDEGHGLFSAQLSSNSVIQAFEIIPNYYSLGEGIFSRDGALYAQPSYTNGNEYVIQLWDTTNGKALVRIALPYLPPERLFFTADGKQVIGYFYDQGIPRLDVWDVLTGKKIRSIKWEWPLEFTYPLPSVSPDGKLLAIPNMDVLQNRPHSVVQILNIENGELLTSISLPTNDNAVVVTFSGDGRWLAIAYRVENNSNQWQIHIFAITN